MKKVLLGEIHELSIEHVPFLSFALRVIFRWMYTSHDKYDLWTIVEEGV